VWYCSVGLLDKIGQQYVVGVSTVTIYIQLYSPECTLAENININNNKQNKDRNIQINTVQLNTFVTLSKFRHN